MTQRTLFNRRIAATLLASAAIASAASVLCNIAIVAPARAAERDLSAPAASSPNTLLPDFSTMVQKYGPAVVNITVVAQTRPVHSAPGDDNGGDPDDSDNPFGQFFHEFPFQPPPQGPMRGEGSGFIVSPDGTILTNAHVVNGAREVTVQLTDRREYTAKVVGVDIQSDVAVIRIPGKNLPTVQIGDSRRLRVGEWVVAIGAPFGLDNSVTAGIVSAKGRSLPGSGYVPFIQTDVPINPGNSGGPLFDLSGKVVGINSQIFTRSGGYQGVSFSIPIDIAMSISRQLQATGHVTRGKLGVQIRYIDEGLAEPFGLPRPAGALVASVEKGGPAAQAGIRPGDVIVSLNGQTVNYATELPIEIATLSPGTTVKLEVWRRRSTHEYRAKLTSLEDIHTTSRVAAGQTDGKLGLTVRALTGDERRLARVNGGVLVEQASGAAAAAGIERGDVVIAANGSTVSSVEDLRELVSKSKGHIALFVQRGDSRIFVPVRIG